MIEIIVDGKKLATLTQGSKWTSCTMLIRKSDPYRVMLLHSATISEKDALKMIDLANVSVAERLKK